MSNCKNYSFYLNVISAVQLCARMFNKNYFNVFYKGLLYFLKIPKESQAFILLIFNK